MKYNFYEDCVGVPDPVINWSAVGGMTLVFWVLRGFLWNTVFYKLAMFIIPSSDPKPAMVNKVSKYLWHGIYYVFTTAWCWYIIYSSPWGFSLQKTVSEGCRDADLGHIHFFFFAQMGWYIHGLGEIIFFDSSRKDFLLMIGHHILSIALLYGSLVAFLHRIGLAIMFEQDLSDIALYICRILQKWTMDPETEKPRSKGFVKVHTIGLVIMSIIWFLTRTLILSSIIIACWLYIYHHGFWNLPLLRQGLHFFVNALLIMQMVWGFALFRMTYDQVRKGVYEESYFDVDKKDKE